MREQLYQDRSAHRHLDLRQRRVYSVARCPVCPLHDMYCFFPILCISFEVGSTELHIFEIRFSDKKLV